MSNIVAALRSALGMDPETIESPEERAERERQEAEYREANERAMKAHWEWQAEQDRLAKQAAERKAMLNSSPPPGRTTHPYAEEPYDPLRQYVTSTTLTTAGLGLGQGNGGFGLPGLQGLGNQANQYINPYQQQIAQQSIQQAMQQGLGGLYATSMPIQPIVSDHVFKPGVPKPTPEFMERYYAELDRAREARVVEET